MLYIYIYIYIYIHPRLLICGGGGLMASRNGRMRFARITWLRGHASKHQNAAAQQEHKT